MIAFLKRNKINLIIIAVFIFLPFIFFRYGLNISGYILGGGDAAGIAFPAHELVENLLRTSQFPFWNMFNFSGYPLTAYSESSMFYPVTLMLGFIFSPAAAYNLSILLHYSMSV
ncbi:MAG: hypothetical protein M1308_16750 [Actinobacteria bacterium]|nr:hypothetical protein [Actinomycetota bacterium]